MSKEQLSLTDPDHWYTHQPLTFNPTDKFTLVVTPEPNWAGFSTQPAELFTALILVKSGTGSQKVRDFHRQITRHRCPTLHFLNPHSGLAHHSPIHELVLVELDPGPKLLEDGSRGYPADILEITLPLTQDQVSAIFIDTEAAFSFGY